MDDPAAGVRLAYNCGMVSVHREVEKKYVADDDVQLPPLTELIVGSAEGSSRAATPVAEGDPVRLKLSATYFDTSDLRLAAAGLTLRRRTGGEDAGWHLKVPAGADARSEVRLPLGRAVRTVPAALQQMVWVHSRGATLQPVAEIVTDRSVRRLVDATGHVLVEIADDRVTARRLMPTDGLGMPPGRRPPGARSRSSSATATPICSRPSTAASVTGVCRRLRRHRSWRTSWISRVAPRRSRTRRN